MEKHYVFSDQAPQPIGTYSQAVVINNVVYLSGQIPLDPITMEVVEGDFAARVTQVLRNLEQVAVTAGGGLNDVVKFTIYLTNLGQFEVVNEVMQRFLTDPYPARAVVQVAALPKGVDVEIDAVMMVDGTR